jgi:S-adenosylmethionine hydrolase
MLDLPKLEITGQTIRGEVARVDRFGNVLTSIRRLQWVDGQTIELQANPPHIVQNAPVRFDARTVRVTCGWHTLDGIHQTYSQVQPGQKLALIGSEGELEIAINQGNAGHVMSIQVGDPVTIQIST